MKVIARTGSRTFLVECRAEELDALAGKLVGGDGYNGVRDIYMGTEFKINEAWVRLHRDKRRKDEVEMVRQSLENIIKNLEIIGPFIEEPEQPMPVEAEG